MSELKTLSNTEWDIMECLWQETPRTIMQLVKEMEHKRGWVKSTTNTMIRRMEAKGYIRYEEGEKARQYFPNLSREAVARQETKTFLDRVYNGRLGLLVNSLVENDHLSKEDLDELRSILHKTEENRDD